MKVKRELSVRQKLGYGAGELTATLFWSVLGFYLLNFLTDEVGLAAGLVGVVLMLGKVWDAVTDPTVGFLSDRTKSRWGRRRPWILFGSIPLGICFFIMFSKPGFEGQWALFVWATLAYILLCTMFTVVNIPYISMVPELTKDFHERTNLNAYRSMFSILGTLIGAGVTLLIVNSYAVKATGFMVMSAIFGVVMVVFALIPFFSVKEPPSTQSESQSSIIKSYKAALKNKQFIIVLTCFALNTTGITVVSASLIYFFKYIHHNEQLLPIALATLLITAMLCLPLAVWIAGKIGKKGAYFAGMLIVSIFLMVLFLFGHAIPVTWVYGIMFFTGIGLSTHFVMPWSMLPDTVEYDYLESGEYKEGIYYGIWTFMSKIGSAFGGFMGGLVLQVSGYMANTELTQSAVLGIRLLIGPIAVIFILISLVVLKFYAIDEAAYAEIRSSIEGK